MKWTELVTIILFWWVKMNLYFFVVWYWFFTPTFCSFYLPFPQRLRTFGAFVPGRFCQALCFVYTNAWDKLGCCVEQTKQKDRELYSANIWMLWGKMWRKLCKLYILPNVKSDYIKKLVTSCLIWNGWSYVLVGSSMFRDNQIAFFKYKNSALIRFVLSICFIAFIVQWES